MRATVFWAACLGGVGAAQELLWEHRGVLDSYQMGFDVTAIGDVDGDGYEDLVQLVYVAVDGRLQVFQYQVWTMSGRDGRVLRMAPGYSTGDRFNGAPRRAGDMDGDGVPDYLVTAQDQTGARPNLLDVRSGRDDHLILQITGTVGEGFGGGVGGIDLDGDHRPDFLVQAVGADNNAGAVFAYSNSGALLYRLSGADWGFHQAGFSVAALGGDMDHDGCEDFVMGVISQDPPGAAVVVSGRTGRPLQIGYGEVRGDFVGREVEGCGDVDGDGVLDFAGGSNPGSGRGVVRLFSGRTGQALFTWPPPLGAAQIKCRGLDFDRDGIPDIAVGVPQSVALLSGRDGAQLWRIDQPPNSLNGLGAKMSTLLPQPGSPLPIILVCSKEFGPTASYPPYLGRLQAYRPNPPGTVSFGTPCPGTLGRTPVAAVRRTTAGTRVTVLGGAPGSLAVALFGVSRTSFLGEPLPWSMASFGLPGCQWHVSADLAVPALVGATHATEAYAALDIPLTLSGTGSQSLFVQWLCLGPGLAWPGGLSDALSLRY